MSTSVTTKVQVYDPAMCCSSGVCGPAVDTVLPRFAADLAALLAKGVSVERYNLSQQPEAFAANAKVTEALRANPDCLPLIMVDGQIVSQGAYPESREQLLAWAGLIPEPAGGDSVPLKMASSCDPASDCC